MYSHSPDLISHPPLQQSFEIKGDYVKVTTITYVPLQETLNSLLERAKNGDVEACVGLWKLLKDRKQHKNITKCVCVNQLYECFTKMSEVDARGLMYCAMMVLDGMEIKQTNREDALKMLYNAAETLSEAQCVLGLSLYHGLREVVQDKEQGLVYLQSSANGGNEVAQLQLSCLGVDYRKCYPSKPL
jgi:TPR repeat protein